MTELAALERSTPWWEEKTKTKALPALLSIFKYFVNEDSNRLAAYDAYSRIYLNRNISDSDYLAQYHARWKTEENSYSGVPVNLAKVMVDSAHAKITRQNPRPVFVTRGGNYTLRKKAEQMQHWVEYCENYTNLRPIKKAAALDGIFLGDGFVKTMPHPVVDEVENERVHPGDIFVDPIESAANGRPTHLYQRAFVNRTKLAKLFEKQAKSIKSAARITEDPYVWRSERRTMKNMVEVVEAWRLPSYPGAGDGKHAIFTSNQVLVLDDWEEDCFPFSHYQWKPDPTVGFWGISLVEELLGLHYDFNHTIQNIHECVDNMPTPYILVPEGGNVAEGQLGNVNGIVINFSDRKPEFVLPPSVPADVHTYATSIWQKALEVSRQMPLGMPDNLGSRFETGQAVRDYNDIQQTELAPQYEAFERFNVDTYKNQVVAGRHIYKRNPRFTVVARNDKYTVEDIEWSKMDDKDNFIIQVFPASMLSQLPAGRKADVLDYFNAGWLDVGEAMDLLDFPDMDSFKDLRNAPRKNVTRILEDILDEGKYTAPEPTLDLRLSMKITQMYINRAQTMGVQEDRIALLRQFMRQLHRLLQESKEATLARQQGMGPSAAGGAPAVSPDGQSPVAM